MSHFCITFQQLNVLNRTMVIGRRWNVHWQNISLHRPEEVTQIAERNGSLDIDTAVDYFIVAKNEFPWHRLPDVVIARRGYDNFLVMMAVQENVSVVDVTNTLVAVHQTDSEATESHRHLKAHNFNLRILGRFTADEGMISSSQYLTNSTTDTLRNISSIVVVQRPRTERKRTRHINTVDDEMTGLNCSSLSSTDNYLNHLKLSPVGQHLIAKCRRMADDKMRWKRGRIKVVRDRVNDY